MIDQTNEKLPQLSDSFYDDDDSTISPTSVISETRIVATKPPVYRQRTQNSTVSSSSSDTSEHDITDVSSINEQQRHPFHLESMKTVLLGLSAPSSGQPSPAYNDRQQLTRNDTIDDYYQKSRMQNHVKDNPRFRLTSSAINRQQQQQRIERENLKILQRLQNVRPTRGLKREELLSNYDRIMGLDTYSSEPRSRPTSSTANIPSTFSASERSHRSLGRSPSATHSLTNSNSIRSRPVSASNRSSLGRKPVWNDGFQQQE
ncbi:unnamed protein product [Rotaria socialis]|uniref:Cilia- and flagella-associated protein 97 n=2 Tax=Rotaria socialis TaxID=392032 RepID=A0A817W5X0_9BILA|nr:unnamed protein product [Rotaria socialis]CAF4844935.1 unnamed protein product [Rotaria socialis]